MVGFNLQTPPRFPLQLRVPTRGCESTGQLRVGPGASSAPAASSQHSIGNYWVLGEKVPEAHFGGKKHREGRPARIEVSHEAASRMPLSERLDSGECQWLPCWIIGCGERETERDVRASVWIQTSHRRPATAVSSRMAQSRYGSAGELLAWSDRREGHEGLVRSVPWDNTGPRTRECSVQALREL